MKTNFKKLCINSFSVLLTLTMIMTTLITMPTVNATENNDNNTNFKVSINSENKETKEITLTQGMHKNIEATCSEKSDKYKYQWQILADKEIDKGKNNGKAKKYPNSSAVITYKNNGTLTDEQIQQAKSSNVLARSYIRYTDANGLLRTHYNDYTGTNVYGGCSTNFNYVNSFIQNNYNIVGK